MAEGVERRRRRDRGVIMATNDEARLRRWLRLIAWACPHDHTRGLVRAAGDAARAALLGEEPPENPQQPEHIGGPRDGR